MTIPQGSAGQGYPVRSSGDKLGEEGE